ncbi:MAG: DUF2970 domain-containing protein [Limnobacter sp.]|nr:DUF2970 domain-containing protein [Limnobacter sp.]
MSEDLKNAAKRKATKATLLQTVSAVLWSFFGVRKKEHQDLDMENLNPIHVIVIGILLTAVFVVGLIILVNVVVANV